MLQHSLLGSAKSATGFCQQLAEALRPAAQNVVSHLQQQQGPQCAAAEADSAVQPQQQQLSGSDLPYQHHKVGHVAAVLLAGGRCMAGLTSACVQQPQLPTLTYDFDSSDKCEGSASMYNFSRLSLA